jgi:1-acyl-sn-glycerol-3-phosphate acyltransferase
MKYLMATLRLCLFLIYSLLLIIVLFILYNVTRLFGSRFSVRLIHNFTPALAAPLRILMGIRLKTYGKEHIPKKQAFLIATNHIGYVELFALFKIRPMAFVAKEEILGWPVIGPVVKAVGTVFVDRTTGGLSEVYIKAVSDAMKNRINFWFAPEKTTGDGTWLRPFSSALFVVANRLKCPLVPAIFVIKKLNGKPLPPERRLEVAWADDAEGNSTPFAKHFLHFFTLRSVQLEMHILPAVIPHYDDSDITERRAFSGEVWERMADALERYEPDFDRGRKE